MMKQLLIPWLNMVMLYWVAWWPFLPSHINKKTSAWLCCCWCMFPFKIMHEYTGKYPYEKTFFFSADIDSKIAKGKKKLMATIKFAFLNSGIQRCIIKCFLCMNQINHVIFLHCTTWKKIEFSKIIKTIW